MGGSALQASGYQIPPEALPYLSAEQIQMLGGSNQQNPVETFIQSLPPEIQSSPTAILQAASSDPSLAQAVIEKFDIPDAGSMTFENPYRAPLSEALLMGAKDVLIPYGAAMGAIALSGAGAGGTAAAGAGGQDLGALISEGMGPQGILAGGGLAPIGVGASMLPGGIPAIAQAAAAPGLAAMPDWASVLGPAADGLSPITVGQSILPGGTGQGVAAVNDAFAGAPLASMPDLSSVLGTAPSFSTPAGELDGAGNVIPGTENVPTGGGWFQDVLGKLGGALSSGVTLPGGYQQQGQDNSALMQMMQSLLQRQRIPTPQGPTGPRYRPYG
jgi:hypothetical protein